MIAEDAAFRPVAGWTPPLRGFWLLVALAACTAAYAPTVALGDSQHDSGYVSLSGNEARQFLVGNSMEDSPAMADGSPVGPDVRYLASETTVFEGSLNGGTCMVEPWGFREDSYCMGSGTAKPACFPFHVLVPKRVRAGQAKVGDVIGYVADGSAKDDVHDPKFDDAILRGNATGCPLIGKSRPAKPLELSAAQSRLVPSDEQGASGGKHASPGQVIAQLLIGNSLFWPPNKEDGCSAKYYYSPDGHVLAGSCPGGHPLSSATAGTVRWKIIDGHFCMQDPDDHYAFSDCDSIALRAVPSPSGRAQLRAYLSVDDPVPSEDPGVGVVMQGNPAGFAIEKP